MRTTPERWSWVDLRLAPAAATVWGATLLSPLFPVPVLAGVAPIAVVAAVGVSRRSRSPAAVVLLGVLAALAVTASTAAVRQAAREASPLAGAAEGRRTVDLELELDGDPTAVRGVGPPRIVVEATVTALDDGGTRTRLDDAVVLFGRPRSGGSCCRTRSCASGQRSPRSPRTRGWWPGCRRGRRRYCSGTRRGCSGPPEDCGRGCATPPSGCSGRRPAVSC
ncbi:MAG: hypothetical protein M3Q47_12960, partial [Actinomycetota bacterium]|nr:hypothetical protein [Actinomycetota bacterium]